jgi:hypothetical protein
MDPALVAVLAVCMRWIHIASIATLIGGIIYARFVLGPALQPLAEIERAVVSKRAVGIFRPLLYTVLLTILGSGLFNYLTKTNYPPHYHMWMGIKLLIVLHIFSMSILYTVRDPGERKRNRWLTGTVISGLIVIAISGYLRWISLP